MSLIEDIASVMEGMPSLDNWLEEYLSRSWRGVVRIEGITIPKREVIADYIASPKATVYVPWRKQEVTANRVEFTCGRHSPLVFHALFNSYLLYKRFEDGLEALTEIEPNFMFGLATTVGTKQINPVNVHFLQGEVTLDAGGKRVKTLDYYLEGKEALRYGLGINRSNLYRAMSHVANIQKMADQGRLQDELPLRILKRSPLAVHIWLKENTLC